MTPIVRILRQADANLIFQILLTKSLLPALAYVNLVWSL
jgi:hypothetical protein